MKKLLLICILNFQFPAAKCQSNYFQQKVDYKISVTLNDIENTVDGFEAIDYTNNSPDTLHFIWFHLWPNAYKNDRTAFSEQLLQLGRTDFYFSDEDKRGYINRLNFKVNDTTAVLEDHPVYIDVAKLILPMPLLPGRTIKITTPFHEKIPFNFSRGGHVKQTYQITQWYPKPAVYDNNGWHPMPYLDQGEFYSEFGNFNVQITLPKSYVVAATGQLQNQDELNWLKEKATETYEPETIGLQNKIKKPDNKKNAKVRETDIKNRNHKVLQSKTLTQKLSPQKTHALSPKEETKTITYSQDSVHDFAWFADKNYLVRYDTLALTSGIVINVWSFFTEGDLPVWKNSIQFIKAAVKARSNWLGEYPYENVSALEAKMGFSGGMEYPTITSITPMATPNELEHTIEHEVGHNWVYGILASNEREHPWMDEGMNTYFDNRYEKIKYNSNPVDRDQDFLHKRLPGNKTDLGYRIEIAGKKDQPIETSSEDFSLLNYGLIAYYKTGKWMKVLEQYIGKQLFDSCLHEYYTRWKFKHPSPADFKKVIEDVSRKNVDSIFSLLQQRGNIDPAKKKDFKLSFLYNFNETAKHNYIFLSPAAGFNYYDKFMIGGLIHNYTLPEPKFHFIIAPMYATGSKSFTAIGKAGYNFLSYGLIRKAELSVSGEKFTMDDFIDSTGTKNYLGFSKIAPCLKFVFKNKIETSSVTKWIQWKTYFIKETGLAFTRDTASQSDIISYPKTTRYLNQLTFEIDNSRALYQYSGALKAEQGKDFIRLAFEGKYFLNYAKGGGMNLRIFGGKFVYLGDKTPIKQFETDRYHLNMTGANGYEDYTYSNYFLGRNEFTGLSSQQLAMRDGAFKVRSDLLASKIGKTDNWLASLNLTTDFPRQFNPVKVFLDIGTYADAWQKNSPTGKFIYDAGLQFSVIKNLVNIYVPILYSKVYSDYFKSTITEHRFWKNISFSIDIQNFRFNKFFNLPNL